MTRVDTGLGPIDIRAYPRRLSHSQISTLHPDNRWSCPRQWSYGYLMKLPRPASAAQCMGRMLDEAATGFWIARAEGKELPAAVMDAEYAAYAENEKCEWPPGDDKSRYMAAMDAIPELCGFLVSHGQTPAAMSLQLSHEFTVRGTDGELVTVTGRSDWVEPGLIGTPVVVDFKTTGTRRWDKDDVPEADWLQRCREQITVYRLALAATGLPDGTVVPVAGPAAVVAACVSPSRKTPVFARFDFTITDADAELMLARIVEADELARREWHAPRPGDACGFCPFVERCRSDLRRGVMPDAEVARARG